MYENIDNIHKEMYHRDMDTKYRNIKSGISFVNYHFVFCPRYRRKIFDIPNVGERFKEVVKCACKEMEAEVISVEGKKDYAHIYLNCLPSTSPAEVVLRIKALTGKVLREEFVELSKMPSLWTRSFLVSTEVEVSNETILEYVESQKKRYQ